MTLVVARSAAAGRIRVIADMRVTDSNDIRHGYPFAALKNVILSPELLVAYAGNSEFAMHTLRRLQDGISDPEDALPVLIDSAERAGPGGDAVDYLLASSNQRLWRIRYDGVEAGQQTSWIGDRDAFEIYQRAYHEIPVAEPIRVPGVSPEGPLPVTPEELEATMRMMNGISSLQMGPPIPGVGEAFIGASSSSEGFRYEQQAYLAADHEQVISGDEWVSSDWGTVANGGFGYSTLIPTKPGIGVVGMYFPHAGLGLLYYPLRRDDAYVYPRVTHEEFRARVLRQHGVQIDGPSFSERSGPPARSV